MYQNRATKSIKGHEKVRILIFLISYQSTYSNVSFLIPSTGLDPDRGFQKPKKSGSVEKSHGSSAALVAVHVTIIR